jgi:hypothetical protein
MQALLNEPIVLMAIAGFGGWALGEWRRGRDSQSKSIQVDATILARLTTLEQWQRDHNTIHGCVRELAATTQAMAKNVDRLTRRLDAWMSANPLPSQGRQVRRPSPYDFPGGRDWILEDEADA